MHNYQSRAIARSQVAIPRMAKRLACSLLVAEDRREGVERLGGVRGLLLRPRLGPRRLLASLGRHGPLARLRLVDGRRDEVDRLPLELGGDAVVEAVDVGPEVQLAG